MQTPEFNQALNELITISQNSRCCLMCAEILPWRCHRSLVGDALLARGVKVVDIMTRDKAAEHKMTGFAKVVEGRVVYPGEGELFSI